MKFSKNIFFVDQQPTGLTHHVWPDFIVGITLEGRDMLLTVKAGVSQAWGVGRLVPHRPDFLLP